MLQNALKGANSGTIVDALSAVRKPEVKDKPTTEKAKKKKTSKPKEELKEIIQDEDDPIQTIEDGEDKFSGE